MFSKKLLSFLKTFLKVINYIYLFSLMYLIPIDPQKLVSFSIRVCHLLPNLVALPKGYQKLTFV